MPNPTAAPSVDLTPGTSPLGSSISTMVTTPTLPPLPSPIVTVPEDDAYLAARMATQPASLEDLPLSVEPVDGDRHRFSLPEGLEQYAYDCSWGKTCPAHNWQFDAAKGHWSYAHHGKYVFRWIAKNKREVDRNLSVRGWVIVNRVYFPNVPEHLFSANGAVEMGDCILVFMHAKRALALRRMPGDRSIDIIKSRMTKTKQGVLMTGQPDNDRYYMPKGTGVPEKEEQDTDANVPGLMEGRDF